MGCGGGPGVSGDSVETTLIESNVFLNTGSKLQPSFWKHILGYPPIGLYREKIRGKLSFISPPISEMLKNWSLLAAFFCDPSVPRADNSNVSAPLKIFLLISEVLNDIPKS